MFGGGGLDPRKMQKMMEQMGIDVDEVGATEVIIRTEDGEELVFESPDVTRMDARGQQTYQIVGEPETRASTGGGASADAESGGGDATDAIPADDVDIVVARTGASEEQAREALEATDGDLAAAVERLE